MSALYGQLSRLFREVSPLLPAVRKRKSRKKLGLTLFSDAAELAWVQTLPGLYQELPASRAANRLCFVVVEAPTPLLLPGTVADFAEAQFRYPAYQVPLLSGPGLQANVDPKEAADVARGEVMALAKTLDENLQALIQAAAYAPVPASLGHILMEKLRVWSVDDYLKPSFLRNIKVLVADVSDTLYQIDLPAEDSKRMKGKVALIKQSLKLLGSRLGQVVDEREVFVLFLLRALPHLRLLPNIEARLLALPGERDLTDVSEDLDMSWLALLTSRKEMGGFGKMNLAYWQFMQEQLAAAAI